MRPNLNFETISVYKKVVKHHYGLEHCIRKSPRNLTPAIFGNTVKHHNQNLYSDVACGHKQKHPINAS